MSIVRRLAATSTAPSSLPTTILTVSVAFRHVRDDLSVLASVIISAPLSRIDRNHTSIRRRSPNVVSSSARTTTTLRPAE